MKVEINKGNYEMDTPERVSNFERVRGIGWEEEYRTYRWRWNNNPKNRLVEEYPINLDIELTTICNLKCPMCYTVSEEFKKSVDAGYMDFNLYKKIIDEISNKVPAIKLISRGETTLYPRFIECVEYAKKSGIKEISMVTNGSTMTEEYFKKLVLAGIDWITISVDGIGEKYEAIRKPMIYQELIKKLENMKKIKAELGVEKPVIKVQGVWDAIKGTENQYYNDLVGITDLIAYNPLAELDGRTEKPYEQGFVCSQIYQRLFVAFNGNVQPCCSSVVGKLSIGNVKESTIKEIWQSDKLKSLREMFNKEDAYLKHPVCGSCHFTTPMEVKEVVIINEREISIKGYKK